MKNEGNSQTGRTLISLKVAKISPIFLPIVFATFRSEALRGSVVAETDKVIITTRHDETENKKFKEFSDRVFEWDICEESSNIISLFVFVLI